PIGGSVDLCEPVHGSAPDIAGKGVANPLGAIASAALLLRHTFGMEQEADDIETAIGRVLAAGYRTADLRGAGARAIVGTEQMGALVEHALADDFQQRFAYHAV